MRKQVITDIYDEYIEITFDGERYAITYKCSLHKETIILNPKEMEAICLFREEAEWAKAFKDIQNRIPRAERFLE